MKHIYLARQPILDRESYVFAYEVLYRDSKKEGNIHGDRFASASVVSSVLNKFGTQRLLGDKRAFIKVDEKFLLHDIIFSIPSEFFIFSLFADLQINEKVVERVHQLKELGFVLAINDIEIKENSIEHYKEILDAVSYVKINFDQNLTYGIKNIIAELKQHDIATVGTKIEDAKTYHQALDMGCEYFQGYYFAKPKILESEENEPSQMNVLNLYNLLMQDVNIDEITKEFENNPEITVQLLQFINSGFFHFKTKISSIHHVLTLVGRMAIAKWLMLMIYSKSVSRSKGHTPLMMMVKCRTELMENILKEIEPDVRSNMLGEAYMVGVLSLVDTIFSRNLEDILESMNISDEVKEALLEEKGLLGEIYKIVRHTESFEIDSIITFEKRYKLVSHTVEKLMLESLESLHSIDEKS